MVWGETDVSPAQVLQWGVKEMRASLVSTAGQAERGEFPGDDTASPAAGRGERGSLTRTSVPVCVKEMTQYLQSPLRGGVREDLSPAQVLQWSVKKMREHL